ncbi:MAG: hypothetical protein ACLQNE_15130 [Thermoguttaceae bacterium]
MRTRCVRQGQMEIGIVEHEGRDFSALGATVVGNDITGYTRLRDGEISLTTWSGQTVMAYRSKVVATYWDGSLALVFRLPRGRFVAGYALGGDGMLFRGELLDTCTAEEAKAAALAKANYWSERDAEDEEADLDDE